MKKIMFNDKYGLTDAVLKGNKTMTRRICKAFRTNRIIYANEVESIGVYSDDNVVEFVLKDGGFMVSVPPYKIGEVVAVAQAYKDLAENDYFSSQCAANEESVSGMKNEKGWGNKLFVAAYYMPHKIRITDIKVERLQDISDEDCLKEGVWIDSHREVLDDNIYTVDVFGKHYCQWHFPSAREAFSFLIDKVSGNGTWESNPYVFAYSFELVK